MVAFLAAALGACADDGIPAGSPADLAVSLPRDMRPASVDWVLVPWEPDLADRPPCGPGGVDPTCRRVHYGSPDALPGLDRLQPDPLVKANGVGADLDGAAALDSSHHSANYVWIPNTADPNGGGTVSKIDSKKVREVARYYSVTCSSLNAGSVAACDGESGCCAADDTPRFAARQAKLKEPPRQAVQRVDNQPSRTSVDFNTDLFVANRAPGGQASVTRIANHPSNCIDRNRSNRIDTSNDTNDDGWIETDCNGDGAPDDLASVKARPCRNGMPQEFYGLDDECVLWTTNVFGPGAEGRSLLLSAGDSGYSIPWIASSVGGVHAIDGGTGTILEQAALPGACIGAGGPIGTASDFSGIAWITEAGPGRLCWFDTRKPHEAGVVRAPPWGPLHGSGLSLDRDQNVWIGGSVARYTPDRSNGKVNLGAGWWTRIENTTGLGIVADSRTQKEHYVFSCAGANVLQIPAFSLPKNAKADQTIANLGWPVIPMACTAVAIDADQNLWGIDAVQSCRALVDKTGRATAPTCNRMPAPGHVCPAGDGCPNLGAEAYSDMVGFGIRGFSRPQGTYAILVPGCVDAMGAPRATEWLGVEWDADVPTNTSLVLRARAANVGSFADPGWGSAPWTIDLLSPADLTAEELTPNWMEGEPDPRNGWLNLEFTLKTVSSLATPRLRAFDVTFRCRD